MQRFKNHAQKYAVLFFVFLFIFLFLWFYYCYSFVKMDEKDAMLMGLTLKDIFKNIFIQNYQGDNFITILSLPFAFAINYIIDSENSQIITRRKSRGEYIKTCLIHIIVFSFLFSILHEDVNIIGVLSFCSTDLIYECKVPTYTLMNLLMMFIYFSRMGGIFLLIRCFVSQKIAPFVLLCIYFIENQIEGRFDWHLPITYALIIDDLICGYMSTSKLILSILGGVCMTVIVFIAVYFKFQKKDILKNEK